MYGVHVVVFEYVAHGKPEVVHGGASGRELTATMSVTSNTST